MKAGYATVQYVTVHSTVILNNNIILITPYNLYCLSTYMCDMINTGTNSCLVMNNDRDVMVWMKIVGCNVMLLVVDNWLWQIYEHKYDFFMYCLHSYIILILRECQMIYPTIDMAGKVFHVWNPVQAMMFFVLKLY